MEPQCVQCGRGAVRQARAVAGTVAFPVCARPQCAPAHPYAYLPHGTAVAPRLRALSLAMDAPVLERAHLPGVAIAAPIARAVALVGGKRSASESDLPARVKPLYADFSTDDALDAVAAADPAPLVPVAARVPLGQWNRFLADHTWFRRVADAYGRDILGAALAASGGVDRMLVDEASRGHRFMVEMLLSFFAARVSVDTLAAARQAADDVIIQLADDDPAMPAYQATFDLLDGAHGDRAARLHREQLSVDDLAVAVAARDTGAMAAALQSARVRGELEGGARTNEIVRAAVARQSADDTQPRRLAAAKMLLASGWFDPIQGGGIDEGAMTLAIRQGDLDIVQEFDQWNEDAATASYFGHGHQRTVPYLMRDEWMEAANASGSAAMRDYVDAMTSPYSSGGSSGMYSGAGTPAETTADADDTL